jgi:hypothetical protein
MHTLNPYSGTFPLPEEAIAIANRAGIASSRVKQERGRKIKKGKGIRNTWSFSRLQEVFRSTKIDSGYVFRLGFGFPDAYSDEVSVF